MPALFDRLLILLQAGFALASSYLVGLLVAARGVAREPRQVQAPPLDLAVIVPAHDEEPGIGATLASLAGCEYPAERCRTIVIADNCSDGTAVRARAAGAEVWERTDPERRGKGYALGWALERLFAEERPPDAVVMVDADCTASANLLDAIGHHLADGAEVVQVDYVAGNPEESPTAALRFAGFALADTVRFLGKERLGLSCGLAGTGMGFRREVLEGTPWTATGLAEDAEFHMRLTAEGTRTRFVPEAWVSQAVPTTMRASSEQQARWEKGRLQMIRAWAPRLVGSGLARQDPVRLHAGLECLVPPQSVLALGGLAGLVLGAVRQQRLLLSLSLLTLGGQTAFVLGGLRLVRAPASVYRALLMAPVLIAGKLALYARLAGGRGPSGWVRTEREGRP
ncbi:MAG: glycosyltransferase family 2 protein [Solirubrobacterales bacterium]